MLLLAITVAVAHSADYWAFTGCTVAEPGNACDRMATVPITRNEGVQMPAEVDPWELNILMCCSDIVPHYMAIMHDCRPVLAAPRYCPTVILADMGSVAWCCEKDRIF